MSAKPLGEYELWFLAGSQEMYGEQVLATGRRRRARDRRRAG